MKRKLPFTGLARDPFYASLLHASEAYTGASLNEDMKEFMADSANWYEVIPAQALKRIKDLDRALRIVGGQQTSPDFVLGWDTLG